MAKKVRRAFSITAEIGKKSILEVGHLLPDHDALPRSVRGCATMLRLLEQRCNGYRVRPEQRSNTMAARTDRRGV